MPVVMYDCGFGDCFCLLDRYVTRPLFVDFGIHIKSKVGSKIPTYQYILNDMHHLVTQTSNGIDFLLTHYHADHFSGLMYMINHRNTCPEYSDIRFENVYIPNVWNLANSQDIVTALLLSYLPTVARRKMNIFDFLMAICKTGSHIHLTERGTPISKDLVALWPPSHMKVRILSETIDGINSEFMTTLKEIANKLIHIVRAEILEYSGELRSSIAVPHLKDLKQQYNQLCVNAPRIDQGSQLQLNQFGNSISIVFHNAQGKQNVLFTGDVPSNAWNDMDILQKTDGISLHQHYEIIKVPHHGTDGYFHDFSAYTTPGQNTAMLIPNGHILAGGHDISMRYTNHRQNMSMYCSNNDSCAQCTLNEHCVCNPRIVIAPHWKQYIP